ncbi:MAG: DNA mismatch repair endonuclease MutL [Verrucomicrobiota bacterium]|nr:DNA mismatch repair endonuclease MutL [Verrucomicrobiota bacterium]
MKIYRLSEEVINRIAAGEVVESPASLLKEVLENSVDAGAKRIAIWVEEGGERLIRVEDDGCGMDQEDLKLSVERHATSKIRSDEDLERLLTMGFRGEALAAIAAVSHLTICTSEGEEAYQLHVAGGKVGEVRSGVRNRGTTVEVRSLFFNVPARKKFCASKQSAPLVRMVETIALAHPEIAFSLVVDGKERLMLDVAKREERVAEILGPMPYCIEDENIWGRFADPAAAREQRRQQYLFINRRSLFSPLVSRAVKVGYGTRIAEDLHPSFVLFLTLDPEEIDVNVHPQKREVRFADEKRVFHQIVEATQNAFQPASLVFTSSLSFSPSALTLQAEDLPAKIAMPAMESKEVELPFIWDAYPLAVIDQFFLVHKERVLLVDLAAASARVLYEQISYPETRELQSLLWPLEWHAESEETVEELAQLGIECRLIGKRRLAIDALPSGISLADAQEFLLAWSECKRVDTAVCRYAQRKKRLYTNEEALSLWKQLEKCREPHHDPSGKRIWMPLESHQLARLLEE